ncbi:hypothetical protein F4778DRAFT_655120 [Xylariomycetidae sp. FL2044]|nr:hypothetical protein F4778DRAFT_655120 [Xylariomycetidae sp. FL2044]
MDHPRPVLPSQRYSPSSEYAYDSHHDVISNTRQPLGESTGNIQAPSLAASALCYHNQLSLSPPLHPIPTPPIVPTQALTSSYGTSLRSTRSLSRNVSSQDSPMGYPRGNRNPIYAYKNFADYRNKVMQKELEKEQPKWPLWLEDAFLDALLLIPQMGRSKFSSKSILYGRNMLITEYLWIYHWLLHPPQHGEEVPSRKEREKHTMFRTRKQVSSHIQVLKGFFSTLVTFHFIFPSKPDIKEEDKKYIKDDEDNRSFKNNRVLISIADGRLPDEKPNYEYFSRLLSADNDVFLRPKQCWIFVSSPDVRLKEKHVIAEDGTTKKVVSGITSSGMCLNEANYPHLRLNDSKDYKDLPRTGEQSTVLLHEYTRLMAQKESSSVKDISNKWEANFPMLRKKLMGALDDVQPSDERTSRCVVGPCDTFNFEVVLDLHSTSQFPEGTELNGLVQLSINRPDLHNHSWRSRTSVQKPEELYEDSEGELWDNSEPVAVHKHRVGCHGIGPCDCAGRGNRDVICVPFPALSWANTFIKLAPYVTAERERKEREKRERDRAARDAQGARGRSKQEGSRVKKEEDADAPQKAYHPKLPSPKELLSQVAMYQEIWSAAPSYEQQQQRAPAMSSTIDGGGAGDPVAAPKRAWTRRAVILWTFIPVHEVRVEKASGGGGKDKAGGHAKENTVTVPPACNWRFLTKFDPTSQYHQERAYLSGSPTISRDSIMSPNPAYPHHVSAAYDAAQTSAVVQHHHHHSLPSHHSHHLHHHQQEQHWAPVNNPTPPSHHNPLAGSLSLLDSFAASSSAGTHNSMVTPPPTAGLQGGYAHTSFEGSGGGVDHHHHHHQLSFMSDGSASTSTDTTQSVLGTVGTGGGGNVSGDGGADDPFLSNLGSTGYDDGDAWGSWGTGATAVSGGYHHHQQVDGSSSAPGWGGDHNAGSVVTTTGPMSQGGMMTTTATSSSSSSNATSESQWAALAVAAAAHQHQHQHQQHNNNLGDLSQGGSGSISGASSVTNWGASAAAAATAMDDGKDSLWGTPSLGKTSLSSAASSSTSHDVVVPQRQLQHQQHHHNLTHNQHHQPHHHHQQQQQDAWASSWQVVVADGGSSAASSSWDVVDADDDHIGAVAAAADHNINNNNNGGSAVGAPIMVDDDDEEDDFTLTASTGLTPLRRAVFGNGNDNGNGTIGDGSVVSVSSSSSLNSGSRKRSRTESLFGGDEGELLDDDDDDVDVDGSGGEAMGYPVHSIRKLTHHSHSHHARRHHQFRHGGGGGGGAPTAVMDEGRGFL